VKEKKPTDTENQNVEEFFVICFEVVGMQRGIAVCVVRHTHTLCRDCQELSLSFAPIWSIFTAATNCPVALVDTCGPFIKVNKVHGDCV